MCERCNKTCGKPIWRYVLSAQIVDHTGPQWITCFDQPGQVMMKGKTAEELQTMRKADDDLPEGELGELDAYAKSCTYQTFIARLRVRVRRS